MDVAILRPYTGLMLDDEEGGIIRCLGVTSDLFHGFLGIIDRETMKIKAVGRNFVIEPLPVTKAEGEGSTIILPDNVNRNTIHGKVISQGKLIEGDYVGWNAIFSRKWAVWIEDLGVFIVPDYDVYGFYRDKETVAKRQRVPRKGSK
jgi:hypothetical protein